MPTDLAELLRKRDQLNQEINKAAKDEFVDIALQLFRENPDLNNFAWWNAPESAYSDGEYPGISALGVNVTKEHSDTKYGSYEYVDIRRPYNTTDKNYSLHKKVTSAFKDWDDLVYDLFNHHDIIIVYEDRVESVNYEGE